MVFIGHKLSFKTIHTLSNKFKNYDDKT